MILEAKIGFLADLRVLVSWPIAIAEPVPISALGPEPSGSVFFKVPVDSEATHMGQVQTQSNPVAEQSEPKPDGSDILFFDSEPTRVGCRRRCRDMSGLSQCLCGETVGPGDAGSIQCQRAGCETIWVSKFDAFASSKLKRLSIIFGVLCMTMRDHNIGPVRHVHRQKRHGASSCCNNPPNRPPLRMSRTP